MFGILQEFIGDAQNRNMKDEAIIATFLDVKNGNKGNPLRLDYIPVTTENKIMYVLSAAMEKLANPIKVVRNFTSDMKIDRSMKPRVEDYMTPVVARVADQIKQGLIDANEGLDLLDGSINTLDDLKAKIEVAKESNYKPRDFSAWEAELRNTPVEQLPESKVKQP